MDGRRLAPEPECGTTNLPFAQTMHQAVPTEAQQESSSPGAAYARFPRRLLALVADGGVLVGAFVLLTMLAAFTGADAVVRGTLVALLFGFLLYDPVLVAVAGGTLGHRWANLRVVADETGGNLPFGRAVVRALVKGILGLPSFLLMAVTSRHQALHDVASRSTVQVRDLARARAYHYAPERPREPEPVGVSRLRRVLVILAYSFGIYIVLALAPAPFVSDACLVSDACSPTENLVLTLVGTVWLGGSAWVLVRGWRGRLPGCRSRAVAVSGPDPDSVR